MADAPPREIQALIDNHINGFNAQDAEIFFGVFGDTTIIIDGIALYRWLNPNAATKWLADVEKWRDNLGVSPSTCRTRWGSGMWRAPLRTPSSRELLRSRLRAKPSFGPAPSHIRFLSTARSGRSTRKPGGARRRPHCLHAVTHPKGVGSRKASKRITQYAIASRSQHRVESRGPAMNTAPARPGISCNHCHHSFALKDAGIMSKAEIKALPDPFHLWCPRCGKEGSYSKASVGYIVSQKSGSV